jgi:UDP-N-acetylmuramoyl-tripeptide--D-alanyl-D-alanine ligase
MKLPMLSKKELEAVFGSMEPFNQAFPDNNSLVSLAIDSREIEPGAIFFAIKGERFDGHDFIKTALEQGAVLAVVDRAWAQQQTSVPPQRLLVVDEAIKTFGAIASLHLQRLNVAKIAVTGSSGKTTTKEMAKAALSQVLGANKVHASFKNYNNHVGLPLCVFETKFTHVAAIFEMGMNHAGEIKALCEIARPDYGVITNIGHAHEGNFVDGILGVARAKSELFDFLSPNGHAIYCLDDKLLVAEAQKRKFAATTTFGRHPDADVRLIESGRYCPKTKRQQVVIAVNQKNITSHIPIPGAHHALNAAAALALVQAMGLCAETAALGLENTYTAVGRMHVNVAQAGYVVIDDGYNANPQSMRAGILATDDFICQRRVAVIGAMGELGAKSEEHHFALGQFLASKFERLFVCGSKALVEGAVAGGMKSNFITFAERSVDLVKPIKDFVQPDDLIFIKGSLSSNMKAITEALL